MVSLVEGTNYPLDAGRLMLVSEHKTITLGRNVLEIEALAIQTLCDRIDHHFVAAAQKLLHCKGRVVVAGIGKSGHIGKKISATFASTGTPSFFLHPAEAHHGDLGMITRQDVVLVLSYSGETDEIIRLIPHIKRLDVPIITLTGKKGSTLATLASVNLDISVQREACPLGVAPTASTTAMLAMGDALALAVLEARGFTLEDFARSHPGGKLGQKLLQIEDVMRKDAAIPIVTEDTLLVSAVMEMSQKRLGFTNVVSRDLPKKLLGIFTDGDLRRALEHNVDFHQTPVSKVMTKNCRTITVGALAAEAIHLMENIKSFVLPVLDKEGNLVGALNMHDLLAAGVL